MRLLPYESQSIMDYTTRFLTIADYNQLIELWRKSDLSHRPQGRDSRSAIELEMKRKETCFIGMFDGPKMIGSVIGSSDGRKGWINRLAIDPDYRRRGLGGVLITECEKFLYGLGLKVIAALIEGENTASFAAFKKAGYHHAPDIAYYSKRQSPDD